MKVKYIGQEVFLTFTNNTTYEVLEVDKLTGALRIIDDTDEDYLFDARQARSIISKESLGRFEIVEDDENKSLEKAIYG